MPAFPAHAAVETAAQTDYHRVMDRQQFFNLIAAIATISVFGLTLGLMYPLLSLSMEAGGLQPNMIGLNTMMQPLGNLASVMILPLAIRRLGAKRAVLLSGFLTAALVMAYPLTSITWPWFILRFFHGFFVAILFTVSESWIVRFATGPWHSRILSIYTSVLALSFAAGPFLISVIGIKGILPFAIGTAILMLAIIPVFFVADETTAEDAEIPISYGSFIRRAPLLITAVLTFALLDSACLSFLPIYGLKRGLTTEYAALSLTVFILGTIILQFPIGWLADHAPKQLVSWGCVVATGSSMALFPLAFGTPFYWLLLVFCGATSSGIYTIALAELGARFSGPDLVVGTSAFSATWGVGGFVGALGAGSTMQMLGPDGLPYVLGLVFATYAAVQAFTALRQRR